MLDIPFDSLPRASFLGIEFLVERVEIKGGLRDHVHEYMHKAGGQPEKLGRKLYVITMECVFLVDHPLYPTGWPGDIGMLRGQFENEVTGDLVIPTVGTIRAYAIDWEEVQTPKVRNGERMRVQWREDQDLDQLVDSPLVLTYTSLKTQTEALTIVADASGFPTDIFSAIFDLANEVQRLVDQVDLQADVLATKTEQLAEACRTFDTLERRLNDPVFWQVAEALRDLGVAAANLSADVLRRAVPTGSYVLPLDMSVVELSIALYDDTSRAMELMKLNPLENPFVIPANTAVRYYLAPPALAA